MPSGSEEDLRFCYGKNLAAWSISGEHAEFLVLPQHGGSAMTRDPVCGLRLNDGQSTQGLIDEAAYKSDYEG
jgi:hypothetical protein